MSHDAQPGEGQLSAFELMKANSKGLRGTIAEELADPKPCFTDDATSLMKFHGTYQQDNRDTRTDRKKAGLDRDYSLMVRTKFPGGTITAEQYIMCDDMADTYGQHDLRITSRQGFQFHGVVKKNLRPLIHDLNHLAKITTLGACGDIVRNTMACPVVDIDPAYAKCGSDLIALAQRISNHFLPKTTAYFDVWLDDQKAKVHEDGTVTFESEEEPKTVEEPIYGDRFLPRKFKIGVTVDFDNSVDILTQDLGVIAVTENGSITGFEVTIGGGLGYTHKKPETYARLGTALAFVKDEADVIPIIEAVVKVQRDFGGRENRKHARLKYLVDDWGIDKVREKVFEYAGKRFELPRGVQPGAQPDYLGWHKQSQAGLNYVGIWIENGRIRDFDGNFRFRTGLRTIVDQFKPSVRLTPHHNIIFANIADADVDKVQGILDEYGIPTDKGISTLRRMEMACPALPLCGLAMAEAERAIPDVMKGIEVAGHGDANVVIRMSGCPNNCSRPRSAEIGIVGAGADRYQLYVGGAHNGTRLCELLTEKLKGTDLPVLISELLSLWKAERNEDEQFGDWSARVGVESLRSRLETVKAV
ncbi:MAG: NADPH-dependent assimilatory sulfite reductase hemoprotein subunit [Candidatus Hydrogenedentes bacterium]|nr:NADPH-dependent assimilatory sulfite reductase hemoprotein subunit [Candidatus Hydrogenedentota bacterium]